jgi:hypothetical protein
MPSAKTAAPEAPVKDTPADERIDLPEQWLELAKLSERTAIETARKFVESVESVPLLGTGLSFAESLVQVLDELDAALQGQFDALRSVVRSAVNVNVNVDLNVDVLSEGVNVDVLSRD